MKKNLANVEASFRFEGLELSEKQKQQAIAFAQGELTKEELVEQAKRNLAKRRQG
ncbi:antitoxin VbhA family protein [Shouchella sp. 1P09AA]|uniref:antitoxin VbhA family protein n=1 Tax=unclassified Shouchella TaxID=2893065 RepID=UPI00399F9A0F